MKTILVPTDDNNAMGSALETALILARRCDSYIEGFALRWEIAEFTEADRREIARIEVQARMTFESFMRKHGVPRSATTIDTPSFGWLENAPAGDAFVGSYARVFDVIVMNRSDRNATGLHNQAISSGLFESGRPMLLAPPSPPDQIGTNVLIAWNRSTEQARATALAMPLLQKANPLLFLGHCLSLGAHRPRSSEYNLSQSGLGVGALDQKIAVQRLSRREDGLTGASAVKFSLLQLSTNPVAPQVLGDLFGRWTRYFSTANDC